MKHSAVSGQGLLPSNPPNWEIKWIPVFLLAVKYFYITLRELLLLLVEGGAVCVPWVPGELQQLQQSCTTWETRTSPGPAPQQCCRMCEHRPCSRDWFLHINVVFAKAVDAEQWKQKAIPHPQTCVLKHERFWWLGREQEEIRALYVETFSTIASF